jgi:hypothetical protein
MQESITNSADGMLLSSPDSLVVSITKNQGFDGDQQPNAATVAFVIDGLDLLKFTYKVRSMFRFTFYYLLAPFFDSTFIYTCIGCDRSLGRLNLLLTQRLLRSITK